MSMFVHRALRSDRLADALGELLAVPLADPFALEVVAIPTAGVERWLAQTLSARLGRGAGADGVCAGIDFCSLGRLVTRTLSRACGVDPRDDPWLPRRLVWPLLEVIDAVRSEPWAAPLWHYLSRRDRDGAAQGGRRLATARHLADLFTAYAATRPAMLSAWLHGAHEDGNGQVLASDRAWQAELWRRLRDKVGPSPAEQAAIARETLRTRPELAELPPRLSVFGATRFDPDQLVTLATLAEHRDVHLWVAHPSPGLWGAVATSPAAPLGPRRSDAAAEVARHRLLGYLGRDVRELQQVLRATVSAFVDVEHDPTEPAEPDTLLHRLQRDIAADQPLPVLPEAVHDPSDRSVTLHSCHGRDRQVEVLRELLVGLLADDPTLEPRDIVVMCPDIETFAPLVAASFGLDPDPLTGNGEDGPRSAEHPGHRLRVRLADRSLRQLNPLLALVARLLQLAEGRVTASDLLDLLASPPVALRFGFGEDDLERLSDLVPRSGVRWGLDTNHRSQYGMAGFGQNTWAAGLDRLLLGVTMSEDDEHFLGTALPMADVDSSDVDLIGRLAEAVDRVRRLLQRCSVRQPRSAWAAVLREVIDGLATVPPAQAWQIGHAYGALTDLLGPTDPGGTKQPADVELSPAEVRALLADAFRGRPSRANFRTGTLTMATLQPMRSVPHRVVCLLGLDDGVFPRAAGTDGDDLLADDPSVGDRDRRSEDRQLLLDAVMAATQRLMVVFSGADPRTGTPRPPAVPVGELLDVLEQTAQSPDGRRLRDHLVTTHPLQPFDERNFAAGGLPQTLDSDRPFSFDVQSLAGASAARRVVNEAGGDEAGPAGWALDTLPPYELPAELPLTDLVRFFSHPARAFLGLRAGLYRGGEDEPDSDEIPVELAGLRSWAIGDRMLRRSLQGAEVADLVAAEWRRGELPPQRLGGRAVGQVADRVVEIAKRAAAYRSEPAETVDVDIRLGEVAITGTVGPIHADRLVTVGYSWLGARQRIGAWLHLLALTVTQPDRPWQAVTIGRGGCSLLGPLPAATAALVLSDLLALYGTGLTTVLPLPAATAAEYARLRARDWPLDQVRPALEKVWARERDAAWAMFYDPGAGVSVLEREPADSAEQRGPISEPHRFGTLARRVWLPLLRTEELT